MNAHVGDGTATSGYSSEYDAPFDGYVRDVASLTFNSGTGASRDTEGTGTLNETHYASNRKGSYAEVSARIYDSKSWTYGYNTYASSSYVSAGEHVMVVDGDSIDFRASAGNLRGDWAEVYAGPSSGLVSMKYSNMAVATDNSASASQRITDLSARRNDNEPYPQMNHGLINFGGRAVKSNPIMDPVTHHLSGPLWPFDQEASAQGYVSDASSVDYFIRVKSDRSGQSANHVLATENPFEGLYTGCSAHTQWGTYYTDSEWGGYNVSAPGKSISSSSYITDGSSAIATSSARSTSERVSRSGSLNAEGESISRYSSADSGPHYDMMGSYMHVSSQITVKHGTVNVAETEDAIDGSARISESLMASGEISRSANSRYMWDGDSYSWLNFPSWKEVHMETSLKGTLVGSSTSSSTPNKASISGNWLARPSPGESVTRYGTARNYLDNGSPLSFTVTRPYAFKESAVAKQDSLSLK